MTESIFSSTFNSSSPYREPVTEILQLLEDAEIINQGNKQQAIVIAKDYLADNSDFISVVWCAEDVIQEAADHKLRLNKQQSLEILAMIEKNHDCCYGISWESIWETINDYIDISSYSRKEAIEDSSQICTSELFPDQQ